MNKPICFVIQEYDDGGFFDELYDLVIEAAAKEADYIPQRADKILGVNPPMVKIEEALNKSGLCLAEVTNNNPNVFLEIGWAIGLGKPYFILWDKKQRPDGLPFDISHSAGLPYDSSKKGWQKDLKERIIKNLLHELPNLKPEKKQKANDNNFLMSEVESSILAALLKAESKNQKIGVASLSSLITALGYSDIEYTVAVKKLLREYLIDRTYNGNGDVVCYYYIKTHGHAVIEQKYEHLKPIIAELPDDYSRFAPANAYRF